MNLTSSLGPLSLRLLLLLLVASQSHCWPWSFLLKHVGKVFNFFPLPVSVECIPSDNSRRTGVCLNAYECKIQKGESHGDCFSGFGVCCVFTSSCNAVVSNNITYFVNPEFPGLFNDVSECLLHVKKISENIGQIRLDFINFNLAQPNRKTGVCETDKFVMTGGASNDLEICGLNSGQHIYYDLNDENDTIIINIRLTKPNYNRMWEIKITQVEFEHRAPSGCLQYFQNTVGTVQTFNFAVNGRHLADQNYEICIRQEQCMCSIVYEPCDENSFKIGPPVYYDVEYEGSGSNYTGDESQSVSSYELQKCKDYIMMPCDIKEPRVHDGISDICYLLHCGNNMCTDRDERCRIESNIIPFVLKVRFGPGDREENPEDNLGMCIRYEQQRCNESWLATCPTCNNVVHKSTPSL